MLNLSNVKLPVLGSRISVLGKVIRSGLNLLADVD